MDDNRDLDSQHERGDSTADPVTRTRLAQVELVSRLRDEARVASIRGGQAGAELHYRLGRYQAAAQRLEELERLSDSLASSARASAEVLEWHAQEIERAEETLWRCGEALREAASRADRLLVHRQDVLGALRSMERETGTSGSTFRLVTDAPPRPASRRRVRGGTRPARGDRESRGRSLRRLFWPARSPSGARI